MGSINWKDVANRAVKTAVQTFLGAVSVAAVTSLDVASIKAGAIAAGAAALSVLWNVLLQWSSTSEA